MVLLVEPDDALAIRLARAVRGHVDLGRCVSFAEARRWLFGTPPHLLLANSRLGGYNGVDLVYLSYAAGAPTRAVIYTVDVNAGLAGIVRQARAFYETVDRLGPSLPAYLRGPLPPSDRRDPLLRDRRKFPRPGRRAADLVTPGAGVRVSRGTPLDLQI